jgi:hypothetical protein
MGSVTLASVGLVWSDMVTWIENSGDLWQLSSITSLTFSKKKEKKKANQQRQDSYLTNGYYRDLSLYRHLYGRPLDYRKAGHHKSRWDEAKLRLEFFLGKLFCCPFLLMQMTMQRIHFLNWMNAYYSCSLKSKSFQQQIFTELVKSGFYTETDRWWKIKL